MTARERFRFVFGILVLCLFAYAAVEALHFSKRARYMPLYVSVAGFILTLCMLALDYWRHRTPEGREKARTRRSLEDAAQGETSLAEELTYLKRTGYYLAWLVGYVGSIAVVGLPVASAVFLTAFLRIEARMKLVGIAVSVGTTLAALYGVTLVMRLHWPPSLLGW